DLDVITDVTEHLLVEYFQSENILATGDDFHAGLLAAVVLADGSAAMIRFEGILDAQLNPGPTQSACRSGVDGFHAQIGQLVGHVIVGAADGHHLVDTYLIRVGAGQMVLLVDDRFTGARTGCDLREGDLAVAAVEGIHETFTAMRVTGGNHQLTAEVDAGEAVADHVLERLGFALV